jgi:hypothetical protein
MHTVAIQAATKSGGYTRRVSTFHCILLLQGVLMLSRRWLLSIALALMLSLTISGVELAHSYLLPSQQIIEFVAKQTAKLYNFRLNVMAESPDPASPGAMMAREMVYYGARPDLLRREPIGEAEDSTILVGSGRRLSVIDGHLLEELPRHEEIFPILLFANSAETLRTFLAVEQVDFSQVRLSRMGGQIAYVIGGPPGQPGAPEFWCDKDRFLPLRLVGRRSYHGVTDLVDIRFLSYQEVAKSFWLPTIIEFYRQDQLFLRLIVQQTYYNERLSATLFDLNAFAAKHPPLPLPKEGSEKPEEPLEEMRRYLEKKYE